MITERMLRKWRKEALKIGAFEEAQEDAIAKTGSARVIQLCECILQMAQELLDQHLLRREK